LWRSVNCRRCRVDRGRRGSHWRKRCRRRSISWLRGEGPRVKHLGLGWCITRWWVRRRRCIRRWRRVRGSRSVSWRRRVSGWRRVSWWSCVRRRCVGRWWHALLISCGLEVRVVNRSR
jgi:hypothetical protein